MSAPPDDLVRTHHPLHVGKVVRHRRRQLGLRQYDLAAAVGVQCIWISKLENGHDGLDFSRVLRTFAALNIDLGLLALPSRPGWMDGFFRQRIPRAPPKAPKRTVEADRGPSRRPRRWVARALPGTSEAERHHATRKSRGKQRPSYDR